MNYMNYINLHSKIFYLIFKFSVEYTFKPAHKYLRKVFMMGLFFISQVQLYLPQLLKFCSASFFQKVS